MTSRTLRHLRNLLADERSHRDGSDPKQAFEGVPAVEPA
jgi:hypothetical protein